MCNKNHCKQLILKLNLMFQMRVEGSIGHRVIHKIMLGRFQRQAVFSYQRTMSIEIWHTNSQIQFQF
jgi:hypothetical protein